MISIGNIKVIPHDKWASFWGVPVGPVLQSLEMGNYLPRWSCDSQPYWFLWCLQGCYGCESVNNSSLFFVYGGKLNILPQRNSEFRPSGLAQLATGIFISTAVYDWGNLLVRWRDGLA